MKESPTLKNLIQSIDQYSLIYLNTPFEATTFEIKEDEITLFYLKDLSNEYASSESFKSLTNSIDEVVSYVKQEDVSKFHKYIFLTLGSDNEYAEFDPLNDKWYCFSSKSPKEAILDILKRNNTRTYNLLKFKEGLQSN